MPPENYVVHHFTQPAAEPPNAGSISLCWTHGEGEGVLVYSAYTSAPHPKLVLVGEGGDTGLFKRGGAGGLAK
jgi:hypothetical protein